MPKCQKQNCIDNKLSNSLTSAETPSRIEELKQHEPEKKPFECINFIATVTYVTKTLETVSLHLKLSYHNNNNKKKKRVLHVAHAICSRFRQLVHSRDKKVHAK